MFLICIRSFGFWLPSSFVIFRISICLLFRCAYLPRSRSAHLIPYLGIELASEVAKIDKWNNNSLNKEPRTDSGRNNHAKSHQCPGKPGAPQTNLKKSQRLPRTPFKTFPLRERRDHESPVLGLSRPQNAQTHVSLSLDSTAQCRCPCEWNDLQPFCGRTQSCWHWLGPKDSRRSGCHRRSHIQINCRSGETRAGRKIEIEKSGIASSAAVVCDCPELVGSVSESAVTELRDSDNFKLNVQRSTFNVQCFNDTPARTTAR